jgi:hypothetical protein
METSGKADSLGKFPGNFQGGEHPRKRAKFFLLQRQPWQMPTTPILRGRMVRVAQGGWRMGDNGVDPSA